MKNTLAPMRQFMVILAMLASSTMVGQAYNCGMFGVITDNDDRPFIGRLMEDDTVQLEDMNTCEVIYAPVRLVFEIERRKFTKVWIDIDHEQFNGADYIIKYPKESWDIIVKRKPINRG